MPYPPDRFAGTEPSPVNAGGLLSIKYEDASKPNTVVTIQISNGEGTSDTITITLDAEGKGQNDWDVPGEGWDEVVLQHPESMDHTVAVSP